MLSEASFVYSGGPLCSTVRDPIRGHANHTSRAFTKNSCFKSNRPSSGNRTHFHESGNMRIENIPVVVVGGGSAAFEAAVAAKQAGAPKVVMLEKAPEPEFGGNARYSHTGFRWVFSGADEIRTFLPEVDDAMFQKLHLPAYSAEQFHADLQRVTRGRIDKQLADGSGAAVQRGDPLDARTGHQMGDR